MKENFYRNKKKTKYLEMLASGKPKRNSKGEIVKHAEFQNTKADVARIKPSRKWFCSSKTVTQNELEEYRSAVKRESPYDVLLKTGKVPYSLLTETIRKKKTYDFDNVFGKKAQRKRPNLDYKSLEELSQKKNVVEIKEKDENNDFVKGQSHRIWLELYKVLDSSDVVIHVLDARDPLGSRCEKIVKFLKEEAPHKHLIYVLNKVDLVPTGVTAKWLSFFSKTNTTIAFHANSTTKNYGKSNLINILRQLGKLYDKPHMSVGFVGLPNIGKSSIINALRNEEVCKVAPIPGETKTWQYITLTKSIYLIDCPGIVPISDYDQAVLKGAIRVENIEYPENYVDIIIERASESVSKAYNISFENRDDLIKKLAIKFGKLGKKGEVNVNGISKMILYDWLRGNIPYFVEPKEEVD